MYFYSIVVPLQGKDQPELPLLIFGGLSFAGAAASLLLPETAGRSLPQTLEDADGFGRDREGCCSGEEERRDSQCHREELESL